jgi:Cu+-exporting ATPase
MSEPKENQNSIDLNISGMTCASCVRHVEKALQKVPGVSSVSVNLATESARVVSTQPLDSALLIHSVLDAGYEASIKEDLKKKP